MFPYGTPEDFGGAISGGKFTWSDGVREVDMYDFITNLSPTETVVISLLPTATVESISPEYMRRTLASIDENNAFPPASDYTYGDPNVPVRIQNVTRLFRKTAQLAGETLVDKTFKAVANLKQDQLELRGLEMKRDINWSIPNSYLINTSESVARRFRGIRQSLSAAGNETSVGGPLTEDIFKQTMLKGAYDDGFKIDIVISNAKQQNVIDKMPFASSNAINVEAKDMTRVSYTNQVITPYGTVRIYLERDIYFTRSAALAAVDGGPTVTDGSTWIYGLDSKYWQVAYLQGRRSWMEEPPRDGDRWRGVMQSQLTLRDLAGTAGYSLIDLT
jgi:hypothetical protein